MIESFKEYKFFKKLHITQKNNIDVNKQISQFINYDLNFEFLDVNQYLFIR